MSEPIRFYFDFASPYAYFASREVERVAAASGRSVEWRPVILWAVFKAQGIASPMEPPARRSYFLADMERSARFFGVDYREPVKLPLSSHLAARFWHAVAANNPDKAAALAQGLFRAFFVEHRDISNEAVLVDVAGTVGLDAPTATEAMKGATGRSRLEACVEAAIADGVVGSPFMWVDGQGFFGADRVPQLAWFLRAGER